ncbi:AarF/UbiB family protein [Balneolaceae bacterium ANBcel3]|nr:AarF/UbiB family protein [Balneolaceae bacterium ANBcel3]
MDESEAPKEMSAGGGRKHNFDPLAPYKGALRRFFQIHRHVTGLFMGGIVSYVASLSKERKKGFRSFPSRFTAFLVRPFLKRDLRRLPFPVQLRRRLELLGPTYIKLGQILSLREDILPKVVTNELKNLLYTLPEVPFENIKLIIEGNLRGKVTDFFIKIDEKPLGSASIAQTHRATTKDGKDVVLKVIKPGIRDTVETDIILLRWLGHFLNLTIPQYQPKRLIQEFCTYTLREVDLKNEADNAEIFKANFHDVSHIYFPEIYREYSTENVLCMEFLDGIKPDADQVKELPVDRKNNIIDYGAEAIVRMLYKDGFFHADLHPGNLLILENDKVGFIDLGMVGRFQEKTRRRMLYYFHALVAGDIEGATRNLTAMARIGKNGNPEGFKRSVADLLRRFYQHSSYGDFSIGEMIITSLSIGARHRLFFPVEMTLMTKALVTYEGVGKILDPKIDIPQVTRRHVVKIFKNQFHPVSVANELFRGTPELADALMRLPRITADALSYFEEYVNDRSPAQNPILGLKGSILSGACVIAGTFAFVQGGPWPLWVILFIVAILIAMFNK